MMVNEDKYQSHFTYIQSMIGGETSCVGQTHFKPASFLKGAVLRFGMFVSYPKVTRELGT